MAVQVGVITFKGTDMQEATNIGAMIRYHRQKSGLTQAELAKLAGTGKTSVFDIEKGKESIQLDTLQKILSVLNIKINFNSPLMAEFEKSDPGRNNEKKAGNV
jgi:HTH-type transcriptional regulator / antitoxin HipB